MASFVVNPLIQAAQRHVADRSGRNQNEEFARMTAEVRRLEAEMAKLTPEVITDMVNRGFAAALAAHGIDTAMFEKSVAVSEGYRMNSAEFDGYDLNAMIDEGMAQ